MSPGLSTTVFVHTIYTIERGGTAQHAPMKTVLVQNATRTLTLSFEMNLINVESASYFEVDEVEFNTVGTSSQS